MEPLFGPPGVFWCMDWVLYGDPLSLGSQPDGHGNCLPSRFFWQRVCLLQCSRMLVTC